MQTLLQMCPLCEVKAISVQNEQAHIMEITVFTVDSAWKSVTRMPRHLPAIWNG